MPTSAPRRSFPNARGPNTRSGTANVFTSSPAPKAKPDEAARRSWVERVLGFSFEDAGSAAAQPAAPSRNTVDYAKARLAWDNARKHLRGQLASLKTAIDDQSSEEPDHDEIRANLSKLDVVLDALDERLLDKLDEVTNAEDAALRFQLAQEARGIALGYRAFVARNPLMRDLDGNPFVPLDAKARIESTLTDLLRQL